MLYFFIVMILVIVFDVIYQKNIKNKKDVIFYSICILIAISIAIYYYLNPYRDGLAEYILTMLHLEGGA